MAISKMVNVSCPRCKREGEFEIWHSIDVDEDPSMKAKVMSGEIFVYKCPHCDSEVFVDYGFSYHDKKDNFMLNFAPKKELVEEAISAIESMKTGDDEDKPAPDCRIRIVKNINHLKEKIKIFENCLDDRVIEMVKLFVKKTLIANDPTLLISELLFNHNPDGSNVFFIRLLGGQTGTVPYKWDLYTYMKLKLDAHPETEKELIIDAEWAEKFYKEIDDN